MTPASTDLIVKVKADSSGFVRQVNRARRRMQVYTVVLPMLTGLLIALIAGTVGILIGVAL